MQPAIPGFSATHIGQFRKNYEKALEKFWEYLKKKFNNFL